jgi:hypothetical protein
LSALTVLMSSNTEFLVGVNSVGSTGLLWFVDFDWLIVDNLNLVLTIRLNDLNMLFSLIVGDSSDDNLVSLLDNVLLESVEILESKDFLFLSVRSLMSNALNLHEVESKILVGKFNGTVFLDVDLTYSLLWLGVDDQSLGGDVGLEVGIRAGFLILGDEATDFSLGYLEGFSLTLEGHVEGGVHGAVVCLGQSQGRCA